MTSFQRPRHELSSTSNRAAERHFGVLDQARGYGKTVIATDSGLVGWFTRRDRLGPLLRSLSSASINAAIDEAFELSGNGPALPQSETDELLARDTVNHFKKIVQTASMSG